ncbi:VOC family protein [Rhodoligotrophos defluvii]|uniref:VOC family protein n=1 Tax=Rhodoligotrophos defluvii TaxID=2561934 RepID=UPI0010CA1634|nr:VOC family protein [Rhodoligotrophos defluvii]
MSVNAEYKPAGHPDVSVYIMANDAEAVIGFLTDVFDATTLMSLAREDGSVMHAEVRIGDSVVMLAQAMPEYPAFPVWLHVYVPDVDATYERALAHGAQSVQEPQRKGDEDRRGGIKDPAGNIWWISTREA